MSGSHLNKMFIPTPPDRGSFPLDHKNVCRSKMVEYILCLGNNNQDTGKCRAQVKDYLACRMDNSLMAEEEWPYLGFKDDKEEAKNIKENQS